MAEYYNREHYPDPTAYYAERQVEAETHRSRYRPLVFICSPFAGDTDKNIIAACKYSRFAVNSGCIPVAPHLIYPQFLDDTRADERRLGMFFGKVLMTKCRELWVFGDYTSLGMQEEIAYARKKHIRVRYFTDSFKEVAR